MKEVRKWIGVDPIDSKQLGVVTHVHSGGSPLGVKWEDGSSTSEVKAKDTRLERGKLTGNNILCVQSLRGRKQSLKRLTRRRYRKTPLRRR